jgi:hypothetical protein
MSPLELIREGILCRDWEMVHQGYLQFTGESLAMRDAPEQSEAFLRRHARLVIEEFFKTPLVGESLPKPVKSPPPQTEAQAAGGGWVDDGTLATEDIPLSLALSKGKKTIPPRNPEPKVEVQCSRCGKKELVAPIFCPIKYEDGDKSNYVCNSCITRGASRG